MATYSTILHWRILCREPGGLQSIGCKSPGSSMHTWQIWVQIPHLMPQVVWFCKNYLTLAVSCLPLLNKTSILVIPVLLRYKAVRWPTEHLTHNRDAVTSVSYPLYLVLNEVPEITHAENNYAAFILSVFMETKILCDQKKKIYNIYVSSTDSQNLFWESDFPLCLEAH